MSWYFFCNEWVKIRGDCSFSWNWWNWWQSLLKLSFLHYILLFKAPFSFGCKKILVNVLYILFFFSFQCRKKMYIIFYLWHFGVGYCWNVMFCYAWNKSISPFEVPFLALAWPDVSYWHLSFVLKLWNLHMVTLLKIEICTYFQYILGNYWTNIYQQDFKGYSLRTNWNSYIKTLWRKSFIQR